MSVLPKVDKIYHYTSLNKAIELILPKKQLLLNLFLKTNDPRETKDYWIGMECLSGEYDLHTISLEDIKKYTSTIIKDNFKLVCFSADSSNKKGYQILSMWAHYGDNHKGVCLEIDMQVFCDENNHLIEKGIFRKMNYFDMNRLVLNKFPNVNISKMMEIGVEDYLIYHFSKAHADYLFFRKSKEWSPENEIRLVFQSNKPEHEYCSINKSLTKIYCGIDSPKEYLPALKTLCDGTAIKYLEFLQERLL